jgi:hypothetical protein
MYREGGYMRVKFTLNIGFQEEIIEVDDNTTQQELEELWKEWAWTLAEERRL